MPEPQPLFVTQNRVVLERPEPQIAKTATLNSLQTSRLKGAATMKAMLVCTSSSSVTALVCKLC